MNLALNQGEGEEEQGGAQGMEGVEAGAAAASPAAAAAGAVASGAAGGGGVTGIGAADLAAVLGSLLAGGAGQGASGQAGRRLAADPGPSLSDVLRPELLAPLLRSPDMVQRLAPFLPEEHRWGPRLGAGGRCQREQRAGSTPAACGSGLRACASTRMEGGWLSGAARPATCRLRKAAACAASGARHVQSRGAAATQGVAPCSPSPCPQERGRHL